MVYISDIPFQYLYYGMQCLSAMGTHGRITALISEEKGEARYDSVEFDWDNGKHSHVFHDCCDKILLDEETEKRND